MLIDASSGTACCCPSVPPVAPVPPMPPTEPDALFVQMSTAQTGIAPGAALPLAGSVRVFGNGLAYDAANHAVIVNETGVYAVRWHVLVQASADAADVVLTFQSLDGTAAAGSSGAADVPAEGGTLVSGSTVALLRAGTAWTLVNASAEAVNIPAAGTAPAVFAASLSVTEV